MRKATGERAPLATLAAAVRTRRMSAVELVAESLHRIEAASELNAVVALRAEPALDEARAADAAIARGEEPGLLAGVPLLVKDVEDVPGLPTTSGSLLRRDAPPATRYGLVPRRLHAAGAVVVGKTNVPEFTFQGYTANRLFGATLNPWNLHWSPGGSSGGSGAALAAGLAPIATASDGGGSIRIPAACCGLAGLKPTNGVIGREPIPAWMDLSTDGPLALTVADLRVLLALEAGPVSGDPAAQVGWRLGKDRLPRRVLAARRLVPGGSLAPSVEARFQEALGVLEDELRLPVEMLEPELIFRAGNLDDDWLRIAGVEQAHELGRETIERSGSLLDPVFRGWMEAALRIPVEEYLSARRRRFSYVREMDELLGDDSVLVSPTLTVEGWSPEGRLPDSPRPGGWAERAGLPGWVFNTQAANMTGHPALSLPAGRHPNGIPFGLHFTGPRYREALLLGVGAAWERARPWPLTADGYRPFGS